MRNYIIVSFGGKTYVCIYIYIHTHTPGRQYWRENHIPDPNDQLARLDLAGIFSREKLLLAVKRTCWVAAVAVGDLCVLKCLVLIAALEKGALGVC
jgi:hypothetical protein